ncbi:RNA 3'-terminal phosphate cyclase [Halorussus halophilus]|uniref:RNA 3'-terminal phosphate cyclase n=1 Tax=Halorussus halophilus TaxID=2650975 RepID=UPI001CE45DA0|nr:RNA 3'-terminal phosphate cyclase [Halorussus halophilus]
MNGTGERELLEIDGSTGGGQLLRTALTLSAITGRAFRMHDVRQTRPNPGLKPQHLAGVRLVSDLCDGDVTGASPESESLTFRPATLRPESTRIDIGTAGSVTLLFDTVLPIASRFDDSYQLTVTGGTDVKWAPTVEYYRQVKLPLLARYGMDAEVELSKTGFYPRGGGEATLRTEPSRLRSIPLPERGTLECVEVYSKAAVGLAEGKVADRQATHARTRLEAMGVPTRVRQVEYVPTNSLGSSLLLRGVYENSLVGFDALGERGRTSEDVANVAVREFLAFDGGSGAVDSYMADQLLVFLALQGGRVRIPTVTAHVRANLEVIEQFGGDVHVVRRGDAIILDASCGAISKPSA